MSDSFCIYCGSAKPSFDNACPSCGRSPSSPDDLAKSLILAPDFQLDGAALPLEQEDLQGLLERIRQGEKDVFDTRQVQDVAAYYSKFFRNPRALALGMVYFFGPVVVGIGFVVWYFFVR